MSKYIDAESLRKEVKRLEKAAHKSALGCADSEKRKFYEGKDFAYQHVCILINSLPEEIPPYCTGIKGDPDPAGTSDLEEEIQGMYQAIFGTDIINRREMVYLETFDMIARHFANWQKEQMMKDAVEGEVENSCFGIVYLRKNLMHEGYSTGDKAKIIIVKEDDGLHQTKA